MKNNNEQNRPIGNWLFIDIKKTITCLEKIKKNINKCLEETYSFRIQNYTAYHLETGSTIYFAFDEESLRKSCWQYELGDNKMIYRIVATDGHTESEINIEFAKFCKEYGLQ